MPVADFKIAFGFELCQGFVTPPASEVPAILTPAFPAAKRMVSVCLPWSPPGTDSWKRAALSLQKEWSTGRRDTNFLMLTCQCLSALTAGGLL